MFSSSFTRVNLRSFGMSSRRSVDPRRRSAWSTTPLKREVDPIPRSSRFSLFDISLPSSRFSLPLSLLRLSFFLSRSSVFRSRFLNVSQTQAFPSILAAQRVRKFEKGARRFSRENPLPFSPFRERKGEIPLVPSIPEDFPPLPRTSLTGCRHDEPSYYNKYNNVYLLLHLYFTLFHLWLTNRYLIVVRTVHLFSHPFFLSRNPTPCRLSSFSIFNRSDQQIINERPRNAAAGPQTFLWNFPRFLSPPPLSRATCSLTARVDWKIDE